MDPIFAKVLNQIRQGKITTNSYQILIQQVGREKSTELEMHKPPVLLPTRRAVDNINNRELAILDNTIKHDFTTQKLRDLPISDKERQKLIFFNQEDIDRELDFLANNILCDQKITLKIGAQVMCIANIDMESTEQICNGSQGIIIDFINDLPLIKFKNNVERVIGYHTWPSENIPGVGVQQIPLILAWAVTIHKAQGNTLESAEIDIGSGIFECGQTYVALSRIKSLDGLYLQAFNPQKIMVHKLVKQYYTNLLQT